MRIGDQQPRLRSVPAYSGGIGAEVVDFMAQIGRPLDEWQAAIVRDMFGRRPDGLWASFEVCVLVARQNGKGAITEARELGGLFLLKEPLILHSAHLFKTSASAFKRIVELINGSSWMSRQVHKINRGKGEEAVILKSGAELQFIARTLGSGRGLTGACNVFDEAAWLSIGQYQAQTPTLSTIPNPQIVYTSTPPDEEIGPMPENAMLPSVRTRGIAGDDRLGYYEWSPAEDDDRTSVNTDYRCNPALGVRIAEWFLAKQRANFTAAGKPEKYATEHLGEWPPDPNQQWQVISRGRWIAAAAPESVDHDPVVVALEVNRDRSRSCIGVAGGRPDGDVGVGIVAHAAGTEWVPARVVAAVADLKPVRLIVNEGSPAESLIPDITAALAEAELDVEVISMTARQVAAAYGMVYDALTRPEHAEPWRLWHRDDKRLTDAVAAARTRKVGNEGTTWDWVDGVDQSPLKAVTHAVWGYVAREADQPFFGAWR